MISLITFMASKATTCVRRPFAVPIAEAAADDRRQWFRRETEIRWQSVPSADKAQVY